MENKRWNKLIKENKNVSYSAIVLDEESRNKILALFGSEIPEGWEILAHHVTINLGPLKEEFGYNVGDKVKSNITDLGISDKAIALRVDAKTMNTNSHITLAINRAGGAKPKDSNDIENWVPVEGLSVWGVVEEIN